MAGSDKTKSIIYRTLFILYVILVAYLCLARFNDISDFPKRLFGIRLDKIVHFCMFFPFPIIGFNAYGKSIKTPAQVFAAMATVFSIGCIFAGLTEIIQGMMPYRTEDISDFYADMLAMVCASVITCINALVKIRKSE